MTQALEKTTEPVQVWVISPGHQQTLTPEILQHLDRGEVTRAQRFKSEAHAACWAYIHACLREILAACTGTPARQLEFQLGKHDKPALRDAGNPHLHFNLSHSGELALLAVSRFAPVGIDIEHMRELHDMDALVRRFFSNAEQQALACLPEAERRHGFYRIWTRKEALIKANGKGLSVPLDAFDMLPSNFTGWHLPAVRPPLPCNNSYPIQHIDPGSGYVGAVALEVTDSARSQLPGVEISNFVAAF